MLSLKPIYDLQQIFNKDKLAQSVAAYKQDKKNAKALWALHYYYEQGWCNVAINRDKAIIFLEAAAQEGHAGASYKLANYFLSFDEKESLNLAKRYISQPHIQFCMDKFDYCNDEPYYSQRDYIILLENFENQPSQPKPATMRQRFKPQ